MRVWVCAALAAWGTLGGLGLHANVEEVPCCPEEKEWSARLDILRWYSRTGGTEFAYSNIDQDLEKSFRGRKKDLDFGWGWGIRAGVGRKFCGTPWDLELVYTLFKDAVSGSSHAGQLSSLVPIQGYIALSSFPSRAKSQYELKVQTLDLNAARTFQHSERLSSRPFVGVEFARIDQEKLIRYDRGGFEANTFHVKDWSIFKGAGLRAGAEAKYFMGHGIKFFGQVAGTLLYGIFDVDHKEKLTPCPTRIKLNADVHKMTPKVEWQFGLGWEDEVNEGEQRVSVGVAYEGAYYWNQNQMVKLYDVTFRRFENQNEDIMMHGISFKFRIDF